MSLIKKIIGAGVGFAISDTEIKRVKILNLTSLIALFHAFFFFSFDFFSDAINTHKFITLSVEVVLFCAILFFQYRGYFRPSRLVFIVTVLLSLFYHCNFAFKGYYGEYQYFVVPLFSLFLFDRAYIHYSLLALSIIAFYVPNYFYDIYPDRYFGYLNVLFLFVGIFLIVDFFKRNGEKNEKKLKKQLLENRKMQKTLDEANKELTSLNKFQNHFLVNIAHEIATPVTLIKGNIGLLRKKDQQAIDADMLVKLDTQINNIESLMKNIMDLAKMKVNTLVLDKKNVSVNKIVQKTYLELEALFKQKEIQLSLQLAPGDIQVHMDSKYFERVLSNILYNAYKYTPRLGTVLVAVRQERQMAVMEIQDSGIGVPPKELSLIFERFYQSSNHINKASGSGIGLAFTKQLVLLHGGGILAAKSDLGGLCVKVKMPVTELRDTNKAHTDDIAAPVGLDHFFGNTILVVEDNKDMQQYLETVLTGFKVIMANNGKEALKLIAKYDFKAIVTDYMMPVMDGIMLVKKLKDKNKRIPTIVITARADLSSKLSMLELGVDDYIQKPFVEEELLLRLKNILANNENRKDPVWYGDKEKISPEKVNHTVSKSLQLVKSNMGSPYYGVSQLSEDLKVSERTLFRVLKRETGLSPNLFIRELKLLEVRKIIENNVDMSLNELAISVGLTNGTYLNQLYEERFGRKIRS